MASWRARTAPDSPAPTIINLSVICLSRPLIGLAYPITTGGAKPLPDLLYEVRETVCKASLMQGPEGAPGFRRRTGLCLAGAAHSR